MAASSTHDSTFVDKININKDILEEEEENDGTLDDELLAYLLTQIPMKKRKGAKQVVDYYKDGKGEYRIATFQIFYGLKATITL